MWKLWLRICAAHRSEDQTQAAAVNEFFMPRLTKGFFIRITVVAAAAVILFGFVLRPCFIDGGSMLPNWPEKGFTFCFRWRYIFSEPQRGDVVVVRYSDRVFFLKRVVGLPGDTVGFFKGRLVVNGKFVKEPYIKYVSNWNLPPRKVEQGHFYVVGDNRSQHISAHKFGQVRRTRIIGAPLF